jgi:hypothetical protein
MSTPSKNYDDRCRDRVRFLHPRHPFEGQGKSQDCFDFHLSFPTVNTFEISTIASSASFVCFARVIN